MSSASEDPPAHDNNKVPVFLEHLVGGKSSSQDVEAEPLCCYVCMQAEGAMLVNVCACRWARIHTACLERLQRSAFGGGQCGVCKQPFAQALTHAVDSFRATPLDVKWKARACLVALRAVFAVITVGTGLLVFNVGCALRGFDQVWTLQLLASGDLEWPLATLGAFLTLYGAGGLYLVLINDMLVGPPTTSPIDELDPVSGRRISPKFLRRLRALTWEKVVVPSERVSE